MWGRSLQKQKRKTERKKFLLGLDFVKGIKPKADKKEKLINKRKKAYKQKKKIKSKGNMLDYDFVFSRDFGK